MKQKYHCKEKGCNNEICYRTWKYRNGRCIFCAQKGERNNNWKGNDVVLKQKYGCIDCGEEIHYQTWKYGGGNCKICSNKKRNNYDIIITKDFLIINYINNHLSKKAISKMLNCTPDVIHYRLLKYKIPIRGLSEAKKGIAIKPCSEKRKQKIKNAQISYWKKINKKTFDTRIKNLISKSCNRPNKFEKNCMKYLNYFYPNLFKYIGDGSIIINRRSADAYSKKLKTVALFNSLYWHLTNRGLKINEKNKKLREKMESKPFLDAGYTVIFIWDDELNKIIGKKQWKKSILRYIRL